MEPKDLFAHVYVVNLRRRQDRWQAIQAMASQPSWPLHPPEAWPAIDGRFCLPPRSWNQGSGAWGCYRSHMTILEHCLNHRIRSLVILEDDAVWLPHRSRYWKPFFAELPTGYRRDSLIYLGGQHLYEHDHPPIRLSPHVLQPFNVNRTHAMAIFGNMISRLYRYLSDLKDWRGGQHIDHRLGELQERRELPIFAPTKWFFGQAASHSDIAESEYEQRNWDCKHSVDLTCQNSRKQSELNKTPPT